MSRTNVFARVSTDHRYVSVGGRRGIDSMNVWINTDNAGGHDCGIQVTAEVVGRGRDSKERRKKDGDQRKSIFTIELPGKQFGPEHCVVKIVPEGHNLEVLGQIGLALCTLKGATEIARGDEEQGRMTLSKVADLMEEIDAEEKKQKSSKSRKFPHVVLPGNVTLDHALACVEIVKQIREQHGRSRKVSGN